MEVLPTVRGAGFVGKRWKWLREREWLEMGADWKEWEGWSGPSVPVSGS